jgi:hypothetical protein
MIMRWKNVLGKTALDSSVNLENDKRGVAYGNGLRWKEFRMKMW